MNVMAPLDAVLRVRRGGRTCMSLLQSGCVASNCLSSLIPRVRFTGVDRELDMGAESRRLVARVTFA